MELREYLAILARQRKAFFSVAAVFCALGMAAYYLQPQKYKVSFSFDVTRQGTERTNDYRFDQFYRLQADERFADTLVRWLEMEDVFGAIYAKAPFEDMRAARFSSQLVRTEFEVSRKEDAPRVAAAICEELSLRTAKLNDEQQDPNWFKLSCGEPIARDGRVGAARIWGGALFLGLFFGFWAALGRHYMEK
ncbi:MAG TPA: hypothetical protein PKA31_02100 [Candidatus Moranbacteria bacterium]|nr:hypothetical protein [Candidatus Moranbacteria bacterium]